MYIIYLTELIKWVIYIAHNKTLVIFLLVVGVYDPNIFEAKHFPVLCYTLFEPKFFKYICFL